jgi:hypothetical protein
MKIIFRSIAGLRDYFGREPVELEPPEDATLQTVIETIGVRWGSELPAYMWDHSKTQFRGPILLLIDRKVPSDSNVPLRNGQEVTVMKALVGG